MSMNFVPKNSSSANLFIKSSFSLCKFSFPSFMLTMLYIVSVLDISSSIYTNSSFVHYKSILLVLLIQINNTFDKNIKSNSLKTLEDDETFRSIT